jgi:hypothetical protein
MAADMVQRGLDDVRQDPEVSHARGNGSPDIVNDPWSDFCGSIKPSLTACPSTESPLPDAKHKSPAIVSARFQDAANGRGNRNKMRPVILSTSARQSNYIVLKIDFRPL